MKKHLTLALALLTVLYTSVHAQLPSYLPADGLVGWWPFNGNANDESGNGNDGLLMNNIVGSIDRFGNSNSSYYFDGVDDFIWAGHVSELNGAQKATISYWISSPLDFPFNGDGNYTCAFGHWIHNSSPGGPIGIQIAHNNLGAISSSLNGGQGAYSSPGNIVPNLWSLITIVFDGTRQESERIALHMNGDFTEYIVITGAPSSLGTLATRTYFGAACGPIGPQNAWSFFKGSLDDIAIYNRALTPQEIQNLFTGANETVDTGNGAAPLPQGIPYQAAARDANGQPVVDSPVNVRFSLREGAADGAASYIESHGLTTNSIGLFNTVFGNGTPVQSAFDSINWAATTKFLQVEVDLGNGYLDMGTTQLLSVPYAFRSAQAANIKNAALPVYSDNTAALAGGLVAGEMYRTATGDLKIVY